jgi:hypothetical protein
MADAMLGTSAAFGRITGGGPMTIVESRQRAIPVFDGRTRRTAAVFLILAPALMMLAYVPVALASQASPGLDDAALAQDQPTLVAVGHILDLLSVPAMLAYVTVLLLVSRPWARRTAWTGFVALALQACGLAAVVGMELLASVLVTNGVAAGSLEAGMDSVPGNPAGIVLALLFFPTEIVGLIAFGIALWRTRWVPRWVPVVFIALPFADFFVNGASPWLSVALFGVFLAASAAVAITVLRDGAPRPLAQEHTG